MEKTQLIIEISKIVAPIAAVTLTAWFALRKYSKENNDKKELMVNAVFGDLTNIVEHFTYAKNEIGLALFENEKYIRLKFSEFGPLKSIEKVDQLGNLSAKQIRLLLQLNLRIRNTDLLLQHFSKIETLTEKEVEQLEKRMHYCIYTAKEIIESIVSDRKSLETEWEIIESRLL